MATKEKTDYEGKATLIRARAKGNATLIAALSGLLLAGGNFLNDFLDRQHQRQLDESTYSATLAEVRALRKEIARHHPPAAADKPRPEADALVALTVESDSESDDELDEVRVPEPSAESGMVQAPSFDQIKEYVQRSGKAMRFDVANPAD